ncbi:MAG: DUF1801 domain-containing protein [Lewinellaceae bacterium]|nr:DUF1801 domain-containing protein [Lewinellaceae bacterium]
MGNPQNVHFRTVDDLLDYLPDEERAMVDILRELLLESIPDVVEKLAYNVPFYYRHSRVCYLWPASVPWGNVKLQGVQLGFCQGYLLADELDYLEKGTRKQVFTKTFFTPNEIDLDLARSYIYDAVLLDEELQQTRKARRKNS